MMQNPASDSSRSASSYQPIEDYGIIGDLHTVALVGKNGSIDWCCLPRFDAPTVFGALPDANKGGYFKVAPFTNAPVNFRQLYLPETNVLITRFLTDEGVGELTDFMPIKEIESEEHRHNIIRSLTVVRGTLTFEMVCKPAFNYARDPHTISLSDNGAIFYSASFRLGLAATVDMQEDGQGAVVARFVLRQGQSARFLLESAKDNELPLHNLTTAFYHDEFNKTINYWREWMSQCQYTGRWREMVQRSALVLKLLTYAPTGAIVAAPTTSLPETIGGTRNWDYRFTWLRDSAFSLYSLLTLGFTQEAEAFMNWLDARCHELEPNGSLQPLYTIDGGHNLEEEILDHLEGYQKSAPVRIGNNAYKQTQIDIYGELLDAIYIFNEHTDITYDLWCNLRRLLDWLKRNWQKPDEGIWEVRGGPKHFLHSRLMSWVAFDRALRLARHRGLPAPVAEWTELNTKIYEDIMDHGWDEKRQSFTQYYGGEAVDASALLMVLTKFSGPTDPRILATIRRIRRELTTDSLVHRYKPDRAADDGIKTQEGTFSACSFWLAESLARAGQVEEGRLMLEKMLTYGNHLGLFAEEIGPVGEALGNYPQAFTHLSLITACYNIDKALNKAYPVRSHASR